MSTTNDRHDSVQQRSQSDQQTALPTFTSIRSQAPRQPSYAESSNASSSRSAAQRSQTRSDYGSEAKDSADVKTEGTENNGRRHNVNGTIMRTQRASGGFLLESSPASSRLSRSILSRKDAKGKEKLNKSSLAVLKRRVQVDGQEADRSRRSSPLLLEIKSYSQATDFSTPLAESQNTESLRSHGGSSSHQKASSFGFETDPAQIVEMALRLNEGRRRQASGQRYVSSASQARRIVSNATSAPPRSSTPPTSAEKYSRASHGIANRKPLNAEPITPVKRTTNLPAIEVLSPVRSGNFSPEQDGGGEEKEDMRISHATQTRVENAKTYFELAYEHRRLLSHLPPLRRPGTMGSESKSYNPLQYARNRKLRFRERAPINSDADGWHDIDKVRAWVDAVVSSHVETRHDPLECVRLPPLSLREKPDEGSDNESSAAERKAVQPGKPRRPKSDWVTHPGDLIADAFWTEQGLNKQKIYDRDNVPIFPPGTRFHFSGWRNREPLSVPDDLRDNFTSPEVSPTMNAKEAVTSPPDLPTFESAHQDQSWARRKSKFSKALVKGAMGTKKEDRDIFDTSSSESNESSEDEKGTRGRKRISRSREKMPLSEGDPFAAPVKPANHADDRRQSTDIDASGRSQRASMEHARLLKYIPRSTTSTTDPNDENDRQKPGKRRRFLHTIILDPEHERGRSSFENDSTAPGTPVAHGFPSIAINLSPPESREPSPSRKSRTSLLGVVKDKMHTSKDKVERTDFAEHGSGRGSRENNSAPHLKRLSYDWSRGPSPMGRGPSPFARQRTNLSVDESAYPGSEPRESTASKVSSKTTDSGPQRSHRVRGMFKGGRIAELVGNEMSRVGDYIWKRDPPIRRNVADGSISGYESDSDEPTKLKDRPSRSPTSERRPSPSRSVSSTKSATPASAVSKPSPRDTPQFHIQGLPSFTSPFQRDRETQEKKKIPQSPGGTPQNTQERDYDSDPVSTAAAARRSAGKSPRLDRLAPPKLDIRAATPDERRKSYGFGAALDLTRTRSASQLYNSALTVNDPSSEHHSSGHKFGSGSLAHPYSLLPHDLSRTTSTQNADQNAKTKRVTTHDYIRTRALFLSTAIKATNINAYCDEIPNPQSSFLISAFQSTGASGSEINKHLPVSRREEHIVAAQHVVEHLTSQSQTFNDHLENFSQYTIADLHREIQILEDMTGSTLFPRLSRLSNQAGQLAQKLTTTSTLAVKGVNDEVTEAARMKRRGPYRWGRLLGYKLIEIGVVGLLWVVWAVVTSVRFVVAISRGLGAVVAWLLFLR